MRRRGLCCCPVSVRLSVTLVNCMHTTEDVVKLLVRHVAPSSFFWTPSAHTNSKGESLQAGALNTSHGVG